MKNENLQNDLMGDKSVLNVEAQKELFAHNLELATRNSLKIFLIMFPVMLITIFGIVFGMLYFLGVFR